MFDEQLPIQTVESLENLKTLSSINNELSQSF